ncbi:tRNA (N(6)-L-threonylcarbamoyladenosine(37)-C(2))-methylthiotransferase MtaB [uncultured Parasphingopyxis sp.]|uniref:tRNA (N(6)-L-threonylcarbamoyladenosine(37)-C(2))- methylthiotransferase MtaB n=1 Tax=uncultured Parasphingopyxis sp. TaxID=1547918 RepID=UPI00261E5A90|nr:tRNA (N(6)-L-threonylcarbamoyladenosine(37)-C(2))-methylthiotransferase MtaB [uncultured Parasphingopyxis sp.]
MSGPEIVTLGCRLNFAESEAMRAMAAGRDDLVIVNSCAVTAEAVRKTRQQVRKARRSRPDAEIVVTGCAAQIEPETFADMPEVDRVLGNREKFDITAFAQPSSTSFAVSDIMAVRETAPHLVTGFAERARAFVEVQNGCDHRCTFCVIPYGRGNSRSVPAGLVVDRIKALVDEGYREIVLTGVDVTSYGPDLPGNPSLGLLVERILKGVPELPRLRLSSIDSVEIDDRLFEIITGEPRFMPHLHLSLQAGDDMILKRMKRRHSRQQAVEIVDRLKAKRPDIAIGADIIAGFPTETDEMAANTLALIDDCDIIYGHIFPYSARKGTPAAKMPQVPVAIRKQRAAALREAAARRKGAWLDSLIGTRQRVLIERDGAGHAENFTEICIRHSPFRGNDGLGQIVELKVTRVEGASLVGEPV